MLFRSDAEGSAAEARRLFFTYAAFGVLGVIATGGLGFAVARSIGIPIRATVAVIDAVADGAENIVAPPRLSLRIPVRNWEKERLIAVFT